MAGKPIRVGFSNRLPQSAAAPSQMGPIWPLGRRQNKQAARWPAGHLIGRLAAGRVNNYRAPVFGKLFFGELVCGELVCGELVCRELANGAL